MLKTEEVAVILGVTPAHVRYMANRGQIGYTRVGTRTIRFDVAQVEEYIAMQEEVAARMRVRFNAQLENDKVKE